jgi:hypothetical protein
MKSSPVNGLKPNLAEMFLTSPWPRVGSVVPIDDQMWLPGAIKASDCVRTGN